jgi:hypothetical protein
MCLGKRVVPLVERPVGHSQVGHEAGEGSDTLSRSGSHLGGGSLGQVWAPPSAGGDLATLRFLRVPWHWLPGPTVANKGSLLGQTSPRLPSFLLSPPVLFLVKSTATKLARVSHP